MLPMRQNKNPHESNLGFLWSMQASNYPDGWLGGWMDAETVNQVKIVAKKQHHEYHQSQNHASCLMMIVREAPDLSCMKTLSVEKIAMKQQYQRIG
jgi:hypothetical protein